MLASLLTLLTASALAPTGRGDLPNVVIVLMDDVGTDLLEIYDELNPYEGLDPAASGLYVSAPCLTEFAAQGVVFTNAYAQPRCSPTRASMMTGMYPGSHGVGDILREDLLGDLHELGDPGFVPERTLASLARDAGHDDCIVGKWHLGMQSHLMSYQYGRSCFQAWDSIASRGGWTDYACVFNGLDNPPNPPDFDPMTLLCDTSIANPLPGGLGHYYNFVANSSGIPGLSDGELHVTCVYATTWQFDRARDWCNSHGAEEPFLCVISLNAAHSPWTRPPPCDLVTTDGYLYPPTVTSAFRAYAAHLEALFEELDTFVDELDEGVRENTVFLLLGDNGTPSTVMEHARDRGALPNPADRTIELPLDLGPVYDTLIDRSADCSIQDPHTVPGFEGAGGDGSFKAAAFEKGIRVPLIVWGAGISPAESSSDQLVQVEDVFATVAELLGQPAGDVDGKSFLWVLQGGAPPMEGARDFIWTERYAPLGTAGDGVNHELVQYFALSKELSAGRFKLLRQQETDDATQTFCDYPDLLYRLYDGQGQPMDPFELVPLDPAAWPNELTELETAMDSLIAAGGPEGCPGEVFYCEANPHSSGRIARICLTGSLSMATNKDDELVLHVANARPNQSYLFFYGPLAQETPFGDGFQCAGGTVVRVDPREPLDMEGHGTHVFDIPGDFPVAEPRYFQAWYRDPPSFNTSDAMRVTLCP